MNKLWKNAHPKFLKVNMTSEVFRFPFFLHTLTTSRSCWQHVWTATEGTLWWFCLYHWYQFVYSSNISLNTWFCKGALDTGVHVVLWENRGEVPGVGDDVDLCFLLCLLGESSGKCLSAPLSRGHQVFALWVLHHCCFPAMMKGALKIPHRTQTHIHASREPTATGGLVRRRLPRTHSILQSKQTPVQFSCPRAMR